MDLLYNVVHRGVFPPFHKSSIPRDTSVVYGVFLFKIIVSLLFTNAVIFFVDEYLIRRFIFHNKILI